MSLRRSILRRVALMRSAVQARPDASRKMLACESGATAVEFAMIAFPLVILVLGVFQFVMYFYLQQTLSNALYQTASAPESEVLSQDQAGYITKICAKIAFGTTCLDRAKGIKVEAMKLANVPTTALAITGTTFDTGTSQDVILLRATMTAPQIVPLIPALIARDSVIFRR